MGGAASRARSQAAPKLRQAGQVAEELAVSRTPGGVSSPAPAAAPDVQQPGPGEVRDPVMGNFLDQLGGSIATRDVFPTGVQAVPSSRPSPRTEDQSSHRVGLTVLKQLLQEAQAESAAPEILAERYGLEPGLVRSILRYNALPVYREDESGRIFGTLPAARPPGADP